MMAPIVEATTKELNVPCEKLMAHERQDKFRQYGVTAVPTYILLNENGQEVRRKTGAIPKPQLKQFLGG